MQDPPGDVLEGGEVILSCFANANPPATTKWVQNGVDMNMMNASSIQLNGVSHASNGNYTCLATNDGFEPVRLVYGLSVRCKLSALPEEQCYVLVRCTTSGQAGLENGCNGSTNRMCVVANSSANMYQTRLGKKSKNIVIANTDDGRSLRWIGSLS